MLTFVEHIHFSGKRLSSRYLPLSYYEQNLGRIDWSKAKEHLPLNFQARFRRRENKGFSINVNRRGYPLTTFPIINGILVSYDYSGPLTDQEFKKIMDQENRKCIFGNWNIPTINFEPYLSTFTDLEWFCYLGSHALTEEQFDLYGWRGFSFNHNAPLSRIPYEENNFEVIFSHPQLTTEFIEAHLQDALDNYHQLFDTKAGYQIALDYWLEFGDHSINNKIRASDLDKHPQLINEKTFERNYLPMWFTDKYRELVADTFNSRPSKTTLAWLKENRPKAYQRLSENYIPESLHFRWIYRGDGEYFISRCNQEVRAFQSSMKKAMTLLFL